jgi:hypothetical protein
MITFEHHGITVTCKPENAAGYRRAMDNPPKAKTVSEKRDYPKWNPTMTTGDYLQAYIRLNERRRMIPCDHMVTSSAFKVPTMYDGTTPEVLEELDPDYTPPAWTPKAKAATAAQLRAALAALIAAVEHGDPQAIADRALSAKGLL